jgi:O-antigen/teichoic acid export membrane protein
LRLRKVRVFKNLGWLTGGQLAADFAAFLFFILLSRRFGPEGVGDYAFGLAVAMVGRTLVSLGVDSFGIREVATRTTEEALDLVGRILGAQCWLGALYVIGCAGFLIVAGVSPSAIAVTGLLTVYHLSAGFVRSLFLPAFAAQRMAGPALLDSGSRVLAIIGGITVLLLGGDRLTEVLIGFPVCGVLLVALALRQARRELGRIHLDLYPESVFAIAQQAWPFAAGQVVFRLHSRADVLMLSLIAGSAATGIYAAGLKFVEVSMMVVALLGLALYPTLTHLAERDKKGFELAVKTLVRGGFVACVVLGWAIFVFVPDLIPLFFGTEFRETEWIIKLFTLLVPVKGLVILGDRLMLAAGQEVQKLRFQTIATGLNVVFNGALIPLLAVEGAIVASVVSIGVNAFLLVQHLGRYVSQPLMQRMVEETAPLFFMGLVAAAIGVYVAPGDVWAAVAFIVSFVGASTFTGFTSLMWTNVAQLAERSGKYVD